MKISKVAIVAVAILPGLTGIGFGIAQAEGTHSEQPVLNFEDMQSLGQGSSSNSYAENRPVWSFDDQEITQVAKSPSEDMQIENPIETGSLPTGSDADSSIVETEGNMYREGGDVDSP